MPKMISPKLHVGMQIQPRDSRTFSSSGEIQPSITLAAPVSSFLMLEGKFWSGLVKPPGKGKTVGQIPETQQGKGNLGPIISECSSRCRQELLAKLSASNATPALVYPLPCLAL